MKIVIVDTTVHSSLIGGAQTFLPSLMKGFKDAGHDVHLITKGTPDERIENMIIESGTVVHADLFKKTDLVEDAAKKLQIG